MASTPSRPKVASSKSSTLWALLTYASPPLLTPSHRRHQLGSTTIGIQTAHGVILAVEKRVTSVLLEPSCIEKILEIDAHIGCAMSGLTPDARIMIDHARVEAQNHTFTFNETIKVSFMKSYLF